MRNFSGILAEESGTEGPLYRSDIAQGSILQDDDEWRIFPQAELGKSSLFRTKTIKSENLIMANMVKTKQK